MREDYCQIDPAAYTSVMREAEEGKTGRREMATHRVWACVATKFWFPILTAAAIWTAQPQSMEAESIIQYDMKYNIMKQSKMYLTD